MVAEERRGGWHGTRLVAVGVGVCVAEEIEEFG